MINRLAWRMRGGLLLLALCAVGCSRVSAQPPYERWAARWREWDQRANAGDPSLRVLADIDSARSALTDSLALALGDAGSLPDLKADSLSIRFVGVRVREALLLGDPRFERLFAGAWTPGATAAWNRDGSWSLPSTLHLLDRKRGADALAWIDEAAWPSSEIARRYSLQFEAAFAAGDTLDAGKRGAALGPRFASYAPTPEQRLDAAEAEIWGALVAGEAGPAASLLDSFPGKDRRELFLLRAKRRLAALRGERAAADSLLWSLAASFPSAREAKALLESAIAGGLDTLPLARKRTLLTVAEASNDAPRFLAVEESVSRDTGSDDEALRGARLLWKTKQWSSIRRRVGSGPWRGVPRANADWGVLLGRTYRNTGVPDSMGLWFSRAIDAGPGEDRNTALWEWARELEYLRRYAEADSVYGRFLDAGAGTKRSEALLRRGICRLFLGQDARAARAFTLLASSETGSERSTGEFWLARLAIRAKDPAAAEAHLKTAAATSGYYAARARSALALRGEGIALDDLEGYWRRVRALVESADLDAARVPPELEVLLEHEGAGDSITALPSVRRRADALLLFRRHNRTEWAEAARDALEPSLGDGLPRVRRYFDLGFPDLAVRAAFRVGGGGTSLRYPTAYAGAVASAARREGVAPEILWSIMRRESIFESSVRSAAGAIGLLQLMQATAEKTAELHDIPSAPLRSPRVNVALGAAHLHDLLRDEAGALPVVIAGYNAGIENAVRWRGEGEDPDLYIERIGYRETREYVMAVLDAFWTYRGLLRAGDDR